MPSNKNIKDEYVIDTKLAEFCTKGELQWIDQQLFCQTDSTVSKIDVESGQISYLIGDPTNPSDEVVDSIQTFTTDGVNIVTAHKSGLVKFWDISGTLLRKWRSMYKVPIAKLRLRDKLLISGGCDGVIKIWDLDSNMTVHSFRVPGVINVLELDHDGQFLYVSGNDGSIYSWDIQSGDLKHEYKAHFSVVTSLSFHHDKNYFASSGRDKVVVLWNVGQEKPVNVVPLDEPIEAVVCLPHKFHLPLTDFKPNENCFYAAVGGSKGLVRIWELNTSKEIYVQENSLITPSTDESPSITNLLFYKKKKQLAVISSKQHIFIHKLTTFALQKQFANPVEILDVTFIGPEDAYFVVATSDPDIRLYQVDSMNLQLLKGHKASVLTLCRSDHKPDVLLSSGRDRALLLWRLEDATMRCLATVMGAHASDVLTVACFNGLDRAVTGSADGCLKLWEFSGTSLKCVGTQWAHKGDVNSVAVAPNDAIIATGSKDATVKLWNSELELIGQLSGHKKGVLCVRFSPVDQVVLTSSADHSLKLWSIAEQSCLKTLEGNESKVTRVEFVSGGLQIVSASGDGLLKLFDIVTSACRHTFEERHSGIVWAFAVSRDEDRLVSGSSGSGVLWLWRHNTEEKRLEAQQASTQTVLEEQTLSNHLQSGELPKAFRLALKLDRPLTLLKVTRRLLGDARRVDTIVGGLRDDEKHALLAYVMEWNTNSRNSYEAQVLLNVLIREVQAGSFKPADLGKMLQEAIPYTERHFRRTTQMVQDLRLIDYTISCMNLYSKD